MIPEKISLEHKIISGLVTEGSKVLELGCGEGALLALLAAEKKVQGRGLEIDEQAIYKCVEKGLSVLQGDIEAGLSEYHDQAFDFVVMDRTFQELKRPDKAIIEALRVGKKAVVSFPNFVYLSARLQIFFAGKVPVTPSLPYQWYDTPNLHFLSIEDFTGYCKKSGIEIEKNFFISGNRRVHLFPNLFADAGIFLISGK